MLNFGFNLYIMQNPLKFVPLGLGLSLSIAAQKDDSFVKLATEQVKESLVAADKKEIHWEPIKFIEQKIARNTNDMVYSKIEVVDRGRTNATIVSIVTGQM
jgi:hypothetical protein